MMTSFTVINDDLKCDCGNDPTWYGFVTSDADGKDRTDDPKWDGVHYKCMKCNAVHAPVFTSATGTDHGNVNELTMPNAEMAGGIFIAYRNGYTVSISLCDVTDEAGLPAIGDEPQLAAKIAQVMTGRQGLVFVTDVSQSIDGWDLTYISSELGV